MSRIAQHNFHLPMPSQLYRDLRAEAARRGVPATALARHVLAEWLEARRRLRVAEDIAEYAATVAGSEADLDPELEQAAAEALVEDRET